MELPLLKGRKWQHPSSISLCPICKKKKFSDDMGMIIEAGACLRDAKRKESGPSDKMEGYMYIAGARKQKGRHAHATIYVAKDVQKWGPGSFKILMQQFVKDLVWRIKIMNLTRTIVKQFLNFL